MEQGRSNSWRQVSQGYILRRQYPESVLEKEANGNSVSDIKKPLSHILNMLMPSENAGCFPKINLPRVSVFDVELFSYSHRQGILTAWSCLEVCQMRCSILFKITIFLEPHTISTFIARSNYILTKLQFFCYHYNDFIISSCWRPEL